MDTDQRALLNSILAAPDDDAPRLIYADWLDENGQPERATIIRTQIELTKHPSSSRKCNSRKRSGILSKLKFTLEIALRNIEPQPYYFVEQSLCRGFAEYVTCSAAEWACVGDEIVSQDYLVQHVKLTANPHAESHWSDNGGNMFYEMHSRVFDTREEAYAEWASRWPTVKFKFHTGNPLIDNSMDTVELMRLA